MKNKIIRLLKIIFSIGWIIPMWVSIYTYLTFVRLELRPFVTGIGSHTGNSAPFIGISHDMMTVGFIWLGFVIGYWVWKVTESE